MPRILADFHHQGLYHSLKMLFEDRLGWELYRPIGKEWHSEGFWMVYNHPATVIQYLGLEQAKVLPTDVHGVPLQEQDRKNLHLEEKDGIYNVWDPSYQTSYKAITLEVFKATEFDVVLSSIPEHIPMYNKLISLYQPKAKHIFQVGNRWRNLAGVSNIMSSTALFTTKANAVFYHQEFDLDIFRYEKPAFHNIVGSYVHNMKNTDVLQKTGALLPGWQFTKYGAGGTPLQGTETVANTMRASSFTWHNKPGGDGFGHVIFGTFACGRPPIVWGNQYRGCLAEKLFVHGTTCIDVNRLALKDPNEISNLLRNYGDPDKHAVMCENAYNRFKEVVNFDEDFEKIKKFLEDLR